MAHEESKHNHSNTKKHYVCDTQQEIVSRNDVVCDFVSVSYNFSFFIK